MLRVIAAAAIVVSALPAGAVVVPGASVNVDLVAQFPEVQTMGGRFIGRYLVTTGTDGLRIFDAEDPESPRLVSGLPIPVFSNEDVAVSASRKLVLLSSDWGGGGAGGALIVVSILNPAAPKVAGVLPYNSVANPDGSFADGVGHVASCIDDCARYAWVTGADEGRMLVVDLVDPSRPVAAGWVVPARHARNPSRRAPGFVHDVDTDPLGDVWVFGMEGIFRVDAADPLKPRERNWTREADADRLNQLVFHNGVRLDERTIAVTEEDWVAPQCNGGEEGSLQTWSIPAGAGPLRPLDQWTTETGAFVDGGTPVAVSCSSHWFGVNRHRVAAVAWYQQGVRFLDLSNPRDIRQVGFYIPPWEVGGLGVSMALYAPGRDDVVYAMSLTSGLVVLKIADGGARAATVAAPRRRRAAGRSRVAFRPHDTFGWACPVA